MFPAHNSITLFINNFDELSYKQSKPINSSETHVVSDSTIYVDRAL